MKELLNFKYTVMLYQQGVGVVVFETAAKTETQAIKNVMTRAFAMFPESKFALHGYSKSDGETTITTERFLGKL